MVSGQGRPHVYRAVKQPADQGPLTALSEGETRPAGRKYRN